MGVVLCMVLSFLFVLGTNGRMQLSLWRHAVLCMHPYILHTDLPTTRAPGLMALAPDGGSRLRGVQPPARPGQYPGVATGSLTLAHETTDE